MKLKSIVLSVLILVVFQSFGQKNVKIGHINTSDLIQKLPEFTKAQQAIEKQGKMFENQINVLVSEYTTKVEAYKELSGDMTSAIREDKETEIMQLEERIKKFQKRAENESQKKRQELMDPIIKSVENAVNEVAKEEKYDYILDTSSGVVLFSKDSDDITLLVKKKLGIN